ncbi:hypothetical protein D9V62_02930 [Buchnera aphidicola (Aphis helianthi)]|uniref:Uncharacterized protein n=1 Tax=Buchnera aphidicola (Aphis helianthi) TaxID=2315802 RepID=A0A4D6XRB6_9GAMM|nr:hypothetical protein [Buchnera aphidicola]QCI17368.1 hypothetical protein D9V62_02930 [Buchnera aphidicola (Aphis helianthi)]
MIFYCSYKWIILACLLVSFQGKFKKNIEKNVIHKTIFEKKIKNYQKKNNFFFINLKKIQ